MRTYKLKVQGNEFALTTEELEELQDHVHEVLFKAHQDRRKLPGYVFYYFYDDIRFELNVEQLQLLGLSVGSTLLTARREQQPKKAYKIPYNNWCLVLSGLEELWSRVDRAMSQARRDRAYRMSAEERHLRAQLRGEVA